MKHYRRSSERGMALIGALLLLMLISALAIGLMYRVNTEQRQQSTDSGNTQSYYGAEAAMEKMMADLDQLYTVNSAPTMCDLQGLTALPPAQANVGVTYSNYNISDPPTWIAPAAPPSCAAPASNQQLVSTGPNAGLMAAIVPLQLSVTADRPGGGEEVSMIRKIEVAALPVFQFGVFSESDLSYFPGPAFDFAGRVQTNGNLFVASDNSITFHSPIRAFGDVVRDQLANGAGTAAQGRNGTILVPTAASGCDGAQPACRNLAVAEGSSTGGPSVPYGGTGVARAGWISLSTTTYNGTILSGSTGAKKLSLPFVQDGIAPIEIVRPPQAGESATSAIGVSRLYNKAQIRVLIRDDPAELPGGATDPQNIRLANVANAGVGAPDYTNGVPVLSATTKTYFAEGATAAVASMVSEANWVAPTIMPLGSATLVPTAIPPPPNPILPGQAPFITNALTSWNLLDGYIRVEIHRNDGTYAPVTKEWLELGFARGMTPPVAGTPNPVHPNAILIFQQLADRNGDNTASTVGAPPEVKKDNITNSPYTSNVAGGSLPASTTRYNWYPINMYDAREGELRENQRTTGNCAVGGIMNVTEIDANNLKLWLANSATGQTVEYTSQNGYVLYYSDRRGMLPNPTPVSPPYPVGVPAKTGEYGFEDVVNPASAAGTPNGVLDAGENVGGHAATYVETWGQSNLGYGFGAAKTGDVTKTVTCNVAGVPPSVATSVPRKNWVSGARHVVRIEDANLGRLPLRPDNGQGGFTLASENPAYILGNYNTNDNTFPEATHAASAVIADAVTLLSSNWTDKESFQYPADGGSRNAVTTYYRVAIAGGKNMNFPQPGFAGVPNDYGTDGGVHNFLRFLENWGAGGGQQVWYQGSMASFYYSQYATGVFKCCSTVYSPPDRRYAFDIDFLNIQNMPPGTPQFRDVVNVGFVEVF